VPRSRILINLVALLAPLAGPAQTPLERAVTLARGNHFAEAGDLLKTVPEPAPPAQKIAFHRLKAAVAAALNDPPAAVDEMQQALAVSPADPALLLATAVAELNADQLEAALRHAESAGDSDPRARAMVGSIQEKLAFDRISHQKFLQAAEDLKQAIQESPKSSRLRTLLGIAQFAMGEVEDAAATLSGAIAIDAEAEPAYRSLTQIVLQSSSAPDAAIVTQLCSWNATVCNALKLRAARESGDNALQAQAIAGLERAPEADVIGHCELARAREWTGRLPDARTEMEKCAAADPSPQNYYRLGIIYQRLGLAELARKQMELRQQVLAQMSEQTANGLSALKALQ
jgi:tetratricopeptide (TPR) repeat protein